MNSQEYRNLSEAYLNVYQEVDEATAMAKRGFNEPAIRQQIASKTGASGAGKFADKATALADRETYGNKGMKAGRENLARKQRGDFRNTTSSSPGLHGYGHKSNDPAVKTKQSARGAQRSALTPNERKQLNMSYDLYDVILAHLLDEGYADTNENALVIMANMSEEWRDSIVEVTGGGKVEYKPRFGGPSERPGPRVYPQTTQDPQKRGMSYPSRKTADKINQLNYEKSKIPKESEKRKKLETRVDKLQSRFDRDGKEYQDYVESYDLYDTILEYLIIEGYADTNENALVIMANMSEEWRESIVEAASDQSDKQIEKGVKTTYKAGNVLDNLHQGRSKGLNKLPRGEREEKAKRMRYRLKTRRDDLFGERNKREDETRAEMKRKYGL